MKVFVPRKKEVEKENKQKNFTICPICRLWWLELCQKQSSKGNGETLRQTTMHKQGIAAVERDREKERDSRRDRMGELYVFGVIARTCVLISSLALRSAAH